MEQSAITKSGSMQPENPQSKLPFDLKNDFREYDLDHELGLAAMPECTHGHGSGSRSIRNSGSLHCRPHCIQDIRVGKRLLSRETCLRMLTIPEYISKNRGTCQDLRTFVDLDEGFRNALTVFRFRLPAGKNCFKRESGNGKRGTGEKQHAKRISR
jgi:hypothetical protein